MKTQVWAHRDVPAYAPENTLGAFSLAAEQGANGVELDVQLTRDHQLAVAHDEATDRVSDGSGYIKDHTLSRLKRLYSNKLSPEYRQASIPTLREVYELLKPTGLIINVGLETGIVRYKGIEEEAPSLATEMGMKDRIVCSFFHHPSLVRLGELDPPVYTSLLYSDGWLDVASYGRNRVYVDTLHPTLCHIWSRGPVPAAMAWELGLHVWAVNEKPHMEMLIKQGIKAITTNKPDLCRSVIDRMG